MGPPSHTTPIRIPWNMRMVLVPLIAHRRSFPVLLPWQKARPCWISVGRRKIHLIVIWNYLVMVSVQYVFFLFWCLTWSTFPHGLGHNHYWGFLENVLFIFFCGLLLWKKRWKPPFEIAYFLVFRTRKFWEDTPGSKNGTWKWTPGKGDFYRKITLFSFYVKFPGSIYNTISVAYWYKLGYPPSQ